MEEMEKENGLSRKREMELSEIKSETDFLNVRLISAGPAHTRNTMRNGSGSRFLRAQLKKIKPSHFPVINAELPGKNNTLPYKEHA